MAMIAVDTETSGLDLRHGSRPFLVTICDAQQEVQFWEWDMNPITRRPSIPQKDLKEIEETILSADKIVGQNIGFDVATLREIGVLAGRWPWEKTYDTVLAAHLLQSNYPKDLTSLALRYLGVRIDKYEEATRKCVLDARGRVSRRPDEFPLWRIAKEGLPEMPSAKETVWKYDLWLPRAVAKHLNYPKSHEWWTVTSEYANTDSSVTLPLFVEQERLLREKGLWAIYEERLKLLPIVYSMQERGITVNTNWLDELEDRFKEASDDAGQVCVSIAESYGHELLLPKNGNNKSLLSFCFDSDKLALPAIKTSKKTGAASLDKTSLDYFEANLPERSKGLMFVKSLKVKRKCDTHIGYANLLKHHAIPISEEELDGATDDGWARLHSSINLTGTDTLRCSSHNPSQQIISKQDEFNLRMGLGPKPGREWWSLDFDNIELRIPAYESGEKILIDVFEKPDEPPYWGSNHLVNASIIYSDLFWPLADQKGAFKEKYKATWYQWCKNFGFACQYSAQESSGTADRAAHKPGAQRMLKDRLKEHTRLNQHWVDFANVHGYVETIPDCEISPDKGYPLWCERDDKSGRVLPTVPLSFHVQGTACWVVLRAMVKVQEYFDGLNRGNNLNYSIIMNIHDELVLDFPYRANKGNLPKIKKVKSLMESMGERISVPLTCGVSYHPVSWGKEGD